MLKKPTTYQEQINLLKSRGIIIDDEENAQSILERVGYYRLSGYLYQFKEDESNYQSGLTFEKIYKIYEFDRALRSIILSYMEIVEIRTRSLLSYEFSLSHCCDNNHDEHYSDSCFYNKQRWKEVMASVNDQAKRSEDELYVAHHLKNYNGQYPLWVLVQMFSFSNLVRLYSSMYSSDQDKIAKRFNYDRKYLEKHLYAMTKLRNICAHFNRLYNRKLKLPVKLGNKTLKSIPSIGNDTLFAYLIVLARLLPTDKLKKDFTDKIIHTVKKYEPYIELYAIGFPNSYENALRRYVNF